MNERLDVIDELERRLIEAHYGIDGRPSPRWRSPGGWRQVDGWRARLGAVRAGRAWLPAAAAALATALVIAVVVALLPGGEVAPAPALAALNRAARASAQGPTDALGPGREWYVRAVITDELPMPLPPTPGQPLSSTPFANAVPVISRSVRQVWMTRAGAMRTRSVTRTSFASRAGARRYGRKLQPPQHSTTRTPGSGKLSSPLGLPDLISYVRLRALPASVPALLRVIARIQAKLRTGAAPVRTTSAKGATPAQTSSKVTTTRQDGHLSYTIHATATVVGRCCGTTPVQHSAVGDLSVISWLLAMPVTPQVRAALYRTAASLPGVRYRGTARDALGRRGVEISVGSGHDQLRMIFDPRTGALLATSSGFGASALAKGIGPLVETIAVEKVVKARH